MDDLFDDTPAHKLARTTDPQTSKDAATAAPTGKMRKFVLDLIILAGKNGTTNKEMTRANAHIQASSITSRPNELEKAGHVFYRGDKRDGCRVIRSSEYDTGTRECSKCSGVLLSFYKMKCQSPKCNKGHL